MKYVDPDGNFDVEQFTWAAVQTFGGVIEVAAGLAAEGVTVGVSTYAVIDGIYNIADGMIGMTMAACDKQYDGAISEVTKAVTRKNGFSKEQQEAAGAIAGLIDSIVDAKATKGLSLVSKGKTTQAIVKGVKTLDKINDVTGKASLGKQTIDATKESIDVIRDSITNLEKTIKVEE